MKWITLVALVSLMSGCVSVERYPSPNGGKCTDVGLWPAFAACGCEHYFKIPSFGGCQ